MLFYSHSVYSLIVYRRHVYKLRETDMEPTNIQITPAIFQILIALADGKEKHGYAIMQQIDEQNDHEFTIVPTTLYRSTKRMLEQGLIIETDERPDPELDDERRRYYQITDLGRSVMQAEYNRQVRLLKNAAKQPLFGDPSYEQA